MNKSQYELKLSIPLISEQILITENVDFEFEILEGNGGYIPTVSEINEALMQKSLLREINSVLIYLTI